VSDGFYGVRVARPYIMRLWETQNPSTGGSAGHFEMTYLSLYFSVNLFHLI
jgi:hypothetical protein